MPTGQNPVRQNQAQKRPGENAKDVNKEHQKMTADTPESWENARCPTQLTWNGRAPDVKHDGIEITAPTHKGPTADGAQHHTGCIQQGQHSTLALDESKQQMIQLQGCKVPPVGKSLEEMTKKPHYPVEPARVTLEVQVPAVLLDQLRQQSPQG